MTKSTHLSPRVSCIRGDERAHIAGGQFWTDGACRGNSHKTNHIWWWEQHDVYAGRKARFRSNLTFMQWELQPAVVRSAAADCACNYGASTDLRCTVTFVQAPKLTNKSWLLYSSFSTSDHIKTSFPNPVQKAVIALIQPVIGARWQVFKAWLFHRNRLSMSNNLLLTQRAQSSSSDWERWPMKSDHRRLNFRLGAFFYFSFCGTMRVITIPAAVEFQFTANRSPFYGSDFLSFMLPGPSVDFINGNAIAMAEIVLKLDPRMERKTLFFRYFPPSWPQLE